MTEYIYAVVDIDGVVENIVVTDAPDSHDALRLLIPSAADIILTTDETGPAYILGDQIGGRFRMPKPFDSWLWNEDDWRWYAPIPYPQDDTGYTWDESLGDWIPIPQIGE